MQGEEKYCHWRTSTLKGRHYTMPEVAYENHLKSAYSLESGESRLVITRTSFYRLSGETAWLISELPASGSEESYLASLSNLGLNEPRRIFERLKEIGALTTKSGPGQTPVFRRLLNPKFQLIGPQTQERFLAFFGIDLKTALERGLPLLALISSIGILWGSFLALAGPRLAIPAPLAGHPNWPHVFLLALASGLAHELGHSWAAAAAGIGLRPIGLSVYLVFPVFYANVSGIETVPFRKKALIDCGGFLFQGVFVFLLLAAASLTGSYMFAEAARWIMALVFFNLNPFFRTDAYWLYKDFSSLFKGDRLARMAHILYCAAFIVFSAYFLWRLGLRLAAIPGELSGLAGSHENLFTRGYSALILIYFLLMGFIGSLRRFREIRHELNEMKTLKAEL